jgi:hypothetical protein
VCLLAIEPLTPIERSKGEEIGICSSELHHCQLLFEVIKFADVLFCSVDLYKDFRGTNTLPQPRNPIKSNLVKPPLVGSVVVHIAHKLQ